MKRTRNTQKSVRNRARVRIRGRGRIAAAVGIEPGGVLHDERGAATAEYAVITVAAVGIAGLLVVVLRSDEVRGMLTELVRGALTVAG